MTGDILRYLENHGIEYKLHADLSCISTMRIGGTALVFASPDSAEKLCRLITYLEDSGIKNKLTGRMSNILPTDEEYQGVIVNTLKFRTYSLAENEVVASTGAYMPALCRRLAKLDASLLPQISSIPATLGGMVYSNAGAHGKEISDAFISGVFFDRDKREMLEISRDEMNFSYRSSRLKNSSLILIEATLKISCEPKEDIFAQIEHFAKLRRQHQPIEYPSLGSIFLRVGDVSAGKLIDECGLKGLSVGGATVSEKHAGFIVNCGGATAREVMSLIDIVKERVLFLTGVELQEEIEFL